MITKSSMYSNTIADKISSDKVREEGKAGNVNSDGPERNQSVKTKDYDIQISKDGVQLDKAYKKAFEIAKSTDSIREDRIQDLKAQIQDGSYKVDSGDVADSILIEAMKDYVSF